MINKRCYTVGTVIKSNRYNVEGDKLDTPIANTQILDHSLSWLGTCT